MTLATTVCLPTLRGPLPVAKALSALSILSGGRVISGLGPGSSQRDYDALGIPFDQRWQRFGEAVTLLRALLHGDAPPLMGLAIRSRTPRYRQWSRRACAGSWVTMVR
jgi:alkanesulfonate monooxygenase SsuD/methylene tetrahydromethanopterin reductase-like flavin-dependent oxidoreductase (luciferase family)